MLSNLTGAAFEAAKHLVMDDDWLGSEDNGQQLLDLLKRPENFGEEREEELLSSMSRLFYNLKRTKDEKSISFLPKFREACRKVKMHNIILPDEALGFLLLNAYGLHEADTRLILNYTHGSLREQEVAQAIRKLEMNLDLRKGPGNSKQVHMIASPELEPVHEFDDRPDDTEMDHYEAALVELDSGNSGSEL